MSQYLFKSLSDKGILAVGALSFLAFVLQCIAVTTSWHSTSLSDCAYNSTSLPDINLYTQPRYGMCSESNYFKVDMKSCEYIWTDSNFWKNWDQVVDAGETAYYDSANTFPDVYRILCATVIGSMISWMLCLFHWFKEEYISRWVTQFICAIFAFVAFITFMYSTIASSASELVNADMWARYYESLGTVCVNNSERSQAGTRITGVALIINLVVYGLCAFPTCLNTCSFCAREESDAEAAASLSRDHQASDADYVPPKDHVAPLV